MNKMRQAGNASLLVDKTLAMKHSELTSYLYRSFVKHPPKELVHVCQDDLALNWRSTYVWMGNPTWTIVKTKALAFRNRFANMKRAIVSFASLLLKCTTSLATLSFCLFINCVIVSWTFCRRSLSQYVYAASFQHSSKVKSNILSSSQSLSTSILTPLPSQLSRSMLPMCTRDQ